MGCDGDHHAVRVAPVGDILLRSEALMVTKIWITYHLHPICVDTALNSITLKPRSVSDRSSYDCHGHMYDIMALTWMGRDLLVYVCVLACVDVSVKIVACSFQR